MVIDFGSAAAGRQRLRPPEPPSAYMLAEMRYRSAFDLMALQCLGFLEGRGRSPSHPVEHALAAVQGFFEESPRFAQAWVVDGRDHHVVVMLVRANAHACHARTALEAMRPPGFARPSQIEEVHRQLEAIAAYAEGVLETVLTVLPAR